MLKGKIPLAWRQLIKRKGRFIIAICGITFADFLILMQLGFQSALYDSNTRFHQLLQADLVLLSRQGQNLGLLGNFPRRRLFQAANLNSVQFVNPLYLSMGVWQNPQTKLNESILVIGFNPEKPAFNLPAVNHKLQDIKYPHTILFDRNSSGKYQQVITQINQGKSVNTELQNHQVKIAGLYEVGASFVANGSVITSEQNYLRIFTQQQPSQVNLGLINLQPGTNPDIVAQELRNYLDHDVNVLTKKQFIEWEKRYWQENGAIGFIFYLGVIIGFLVGVIIVYQIIYSDVIDHLPEYATLKAIGYPQTYLLLVVFQEASILAISGFIPGSLVSFIMYGFTRYITKLPLFITPSKIILVLALTIIMCLISAAIATRKLNSADPADIF